MKSRRLTLRDLIWAAIAVASILAIVLFLDVRHEKHVADDTADVSAVIDRFQEAYSSKRINDVRNLFYAEAVVAVDFDQGHTQHVASLEEWLQGTQEETFNTNTLVSDTLSDRDIVVLRNIAYVVCNYTYIDDTSRQQGVDVITLMKLHDRWRILSLQWTGDTVK